MDDKNQETSKPDSNQEQYVIFQVGNEVYGVPILSVREIRPWQQPTPLPDAPADVHGMIDLRGIVVPIYDFHHHLTGKPAEILSSTVVIIIQVQDRLIGMYVDTVNDITNVPSNDIKKAPAVEKLRDTQNIIGVTTINDRMATLINLDHFFNLDQVP